MRIVSLTYINSPDFNDPYAWLERLYAFTGVLEELSKEHEVYSIEQINFEGDLTQKGVQYYFRRYGHGVTRIPRNLHRLVKKLNPDIVMVRGLHFPLQVIQLRMKLGRKVRIVVENHAGKPPHGIRKLFQHVAYSSIDAYHFISSGTAHQWLHSGIIRNRQKCVEVPAGSARIIPLDKTDSRRRLGITGGFIFLWVGNLSRNKDPLTVIAGFERYLMINPDAKLYMIYQTDELLLEIEKKLKGNEFLEKAVILKGLIPNDQLSPWYSGADFYISGSHSEGGSIALLEAIACGCIPVVTAIPSSLAATDYGRYGFHFMPGNVDDLYEQLQRLNTVIVKEFSGAIRNYFRDELSFPAIARKFKASCGLV
jgi:glycosyltransferase involved in cell wall biosynthesis